MAISIFSKAALNNARSHKPWERAENDERDNIETLQFDFDDAAAPTASAVGSQVSAAAPDVQPTSVAHEITHVALRHSPPMPDMEGVSALAGNTDAPVGSEKPVDLQSAPATVQPSFGAPTAQAIDLTPAPAPQAGGIGGPIESIDESNLEDLYDHLYRDSDDWGGGATLRVGFPQSYEQIPEHFRNIDDGSDYIGEPPLLRRDAARAHMAGAVHLVGRRQHHFRTGRSRRRSRHLYLRHGVRQQFRRRFHGRRSRSRQPDRAQHVPRYAARRAAGVGRLRDAGPRDRAFARPDASRRLQRRRHGISDLLRRRRVHPGYEDVLRHVLL